MAAVTRSSSDGLDVYVRNVHALDGHGVKVGIQSDAGTHEGTSILDIAIYNEFGTETIPARPFIRDFAQRNERVLGMAMDRVATLIERGTPVDVGLAQLGEFAQNNQRAHVRASNSWAVPNALSTINVKGSDVPLIDDGVLVNAIRWEKT